MTNEIPAGRELDALVAEKVMGNLPTIPATAREARQQGWRAPTHSDDWGPTTRRRFGRVVLVAPVEWAMARHLYPAYSTDIAAAWLVVEKMHADGWGIVLEYDHPHPDGFVVVGTNAAGRWTCWMQNTTGDPVTPSGDTAPLAICRAALQAVAA